MLQISKEDMVLYYYASFSEINAVFTYRFAERARSWVSSADWSVPPEAKPRADGSQWNAGWAAWNCKGRGKNKLHDTHVCSWTGRHDLCLLSLLSWSDAMLLFLDRSTPPWALDARRPPSVLRKHRGDRECWRALTVSSHTHTHTPSTHSNVFYVPFKA